MTQVMPPETGFETADFLDTKIRFPSYGFFASAKVSKFSPKLDKYCVISSRVFISILLCFLNIFWSC